MFNHGTVEAPRMRWFKGDIRKSDVIIIGVMLLLVLLIVVFALLGWGPQTAQPGQATGTIATQTAKEQLIKLQRDNERSFSAWFWNSGVALISSLAVVLGGVVTVFKYFGDRKAEREKRDDDRLQNTIAGLGSERIEARAIAASMLLTFLQQPGYERFHQQIFNLAVTNLRLPHVDPSTPERLDPLGQALITVFKESFPLARKALIGQEEPQFDMLQPLDASRIRLDYAFLRYAKLEGIWMRDAFLSGADLRKANLSNAYLTKTDLSDANLRKAILCGARLHHAYLGHAHLRDAVLNGAYLKWANFDGAQLKRADLRGADFDGEPQIEGAADLRGADLRGAKGLTKEQLEACKAKGAIIDEAPATSPPQSPVSPAPTSQSTDT
jgi:uncharacterized protein YjbI with pentapeptide repeats